MPNASSEFIGSFSYVTGNYDLSGLKGLKDSISKDKTAYYFSLPTHFEIIKSLISGLNHLNLLDKNSQVIIEKPFGTDKTSAGKLMKYLKEEVGEDGLFLIDHYLAKSLVRNLVSLRFANPVFKNLWNNKFIRNIEILASEKVGINKRGEYYDKTGAIKDMIQNHVL